MTREDVLHTIREHQTELLARGVQHVRLFGSVARKEQRLSSDIDLAVEVETGKPWSLFAYGGLQNDLSNWLGEKVHVSPMHWMRPALQSQVLAEAVDAF